MIEEFRAYHWSLRATGCAAVDAVLAAVARAAATYHDCGAWQEKSHDGTSCVERIQAAADRAAASLAPPSVLPPEPHQQALARDAAEFFSAES